MTIMSGLIYRQKVLFLSVADRLCLSLLVTFVHVQDPWSEEVIEHSDSETPRGVISSPPNIEQVTGQDIAPSSGYEFGLEALSTVAAADQYRYRVPNALRGTGYIQLPPANHDTRSPAPRPMSEEGDRLTLPFSGRATAASRGSPGGVIATVANPNLVRSSPLESSLNFRNIPGDHATESPALLEDQHEVAFLLRHYAEVPGYG